MRVIVTTSVAPGEVLRYHMQSERDSHRLLHRGLPRDIYVVHPDMYSKLVDRIGPLEAAGIAVDDLTPDERAEVPVIFQRLERRIRSGELVPGRD